MVSKNNVALAVLLGGAVFAQSAWAQKVDCAAWAQRLQARADAFDARCATTPMTINGPQWRACQAEQTAILKQRDQWIAACRR